MAQGRPERKVASRGGGFLEGKKVQVQGTSTRTSETFRRGIIDRPWGVGVWDVRPSGFREAMRMEARIKQWQRTRRKLVTQGTPTAVWHRRSSRPPDYGDRPPESAQRISIKRAARGRFDADP